MILHPPFLITSRLAPGLEIGEGIFLSLVGTEWAKRDPTRDTAKLVIDFPDGAVYEDDSLQSPVGGFRGMVTIFTSFLSFLGAALDSFRAEEVTGVEGENSKLFPRWVLERMDDEYETVEGLHLMLAYDENGNCVDRSDLIEEEA